MPNKITVNHKIKSFDKSIIIPGDKSLSIRWVLIASLASGKSIANNLLMSEDVKAAIKTVRKFGIKVKVKKKRCEIYGKGIYGYVFKKGITIDAKNSGTLARLILGLIIDSPFPIKLIGDQSLSKRDFRRVTDPLSKFGVKFKYKNKNGLPLSLTGSNKLKAISYSENRGSAQCKSSIIFGSLKAKGKTQIKAKKSRNHTELLFKSLKLPIKVLKKNNFDYIELNPVNKIRKLNYNIPSDISSAAFFIILTALTKNSKLLIKNININPSRIGVIKILKIMGVKIKFQKIKIYKGEKISDIMISSPKKIKRINCPVNLNSGAIDEFLSVFLLAAKAEGISYFKKLEELDKKESPRLKWGAKILKLIGVKVVSTNNSIKIYGNPKLTIRKKIVIKNYLKDHRVFMTSMIAALAFGGKWEIHDKDSINTSFPTFLKLVSKLKK